MAKIIDPEEVDELQEDIVKTQMPSGGVPSVYILRYNGTSPCASSEADKSAWSYVPKVDVSLWKVHKNNEGYIQNWSHHEESIIEGYTTNEVIEFCVGYMSDLFNWTTRFHQKVALK